MFNKILGICLLASTCLSASFSDNSEEKIIFKKVPVITAEMMEDSAALQRAFSDAEKYIIKRINGVVTFTVNDSHQDSLPTALSFLERSLNHPIDELEDLIKGNGGFMIEAVFSSCHKQDSSFTSTSSSTSTTKTTLGFKR